MQRGEKKVAYRAQEDIDGLQRLLEEKRAQLAEHRRRLHDDPDDEETTSAKVVRAERGGLRRVL